MKIWRYMDLPKFINLLSTRTLYFTCLSRFPDTYEGWMPRSYMKAMEQLCCAQISEIQQKKEYIASHNKYNNNIVINSASKNIEDQFALKKVFKELNEKFGANCWHINEVESEAMWHLYGATGAGIAIESTREQLENSIKGATPHKVIVDVIKYMDFDVDPIDKGIKGNIIGFIKRKSFEHEKELRAMVRLPSIGVGTNVKCDLNVLISKIYIAPRAEKYYVDAVKFILNSINTKIDATVEVSKLLDEPNY